MARHYRVTIDIGVFDPDALKVAAERAAAAGGVPPYQWAETRAAHPDPIGLDLQMILDPGESPAGTSINDSTVDCYFCGPPADPSPRLTRESYGEPTTKESAESDDD